MTAAPLLVFGWGNRSRGDDALGPLFIEELRSRAGDRCKDRVQFLEDYQLQVEHALDLASRERVLFVDASLSCAIPFEVWPLRAARDASFTTHPMSPESLLQVFCDLQQVEPPPCTMLAIRGTQFALGEPPGEAALANLERALTWGLRWMESGCGIE
jgi:hydrogenase maturation protease